ncbi:hypothetical protein APR41_11425 [Salegentibacter salinarum]|uniref:DUF4113 domain-containing protein n=2 Tax=Salegentibacter salinarum TaxID=447422 RepID=A0A2N0TMB2_9FLAO|nr:hypothetical protein APR41_11425 [Salegentibacter salinarum]
MLTKAALYGSKQIFKPGCQYKIIIGITSASEWQLSLFSEKNTRHHKFMKTIDRLNRIENGKIKFTGMDPGQTWKMKQERLHIVIPIGLIRLFGLSVLKRKHRF